MSLITLTFGNGNNKSVLARTTQMAGPLENLKASSINKVKVKKVNQFFGERNVYIIGEITEGVLFEQMKSVVGDKTGLIVELESKFGKAKAKKGMNVGLLLAGVEKDDIQEGQVLNFVV